MDQFIEELASAGVHEKVFSIVQRLPGENIFDAPTGFGALAERMLALGKKVTAGDIDTDKFKLDPDRERLTLLRLDLTDPNLQIGSNDYDIAICVEGVEHLENQWILARNLFRLLKPGGFLILTTPNILNFRSRVRFFLEGRYEFFKRPLVKGKSPAHDLDTYHIAPVSYFELQFILESSGFAIKELHTNKYSSRNIISMLLRPLYKLIYSYKDSRDKRRGRGEYAELYKLILSDEIYYGETLIIVAQKQ
ncbi:methyltransferase domain-containing protein [Geobacter sp.]|uniref:class I SAM-dependent methyltransferase n=1 Tax=Geobacter sp. TaxID=46610 RepID=UPI0026209439|nr:methyltransferase domain-containing protein [Geobacter sp.]